jgi:hypothetical protein
VNIKTLTIVSIIKPNIIYTFARIGLANRNTLIELSYSGVKLYIKSKLYYRSTKLQLIDRFTTLLNLEPLVGLAKGVPFLTVHEIITYVNWKIYSYPAYILINKKDP